MFDKIDRDKLIKKYPFLEIDNEHKYTWLDDLEPGWKIAFGKELCDDLLNALEEDGCLDSFKFLQIKEKFAGLRLYAFGYGDNTRNILAKYEELSKFYCGHCGKPAEYITTGWYYPLCKDCIKEINSKYLPIEDFYKFDSYDDIQKEIDSIINDFQYDKYYQTIN